MNTILVISILIVLVSFVLFCIWMHFENIHLTKKEYTIVSDKLPSVFSGTRFIMLSDLHNNQFGNNNEILVKAIQNEQPEFIVIAGDMIVSKDGQSFDVAYNLIEQLVQLCPVYYGYGNHEQRLKKREEDHEVLEPSFLAYEEQLKNLGVVILDNKDMVFERKGKHIRLTGLSIGLEYFKKFPRPKMKVQYINETIGEKKSYTILIAHNPEYFEQYAEWGADLVLSGHIHGGMVRLPFIGGVVSPQYRLFPKYDSGYFKKEIGKLTSQMIISRGLGIHTIKIRVFNRPELVVIKLDKKEGI